MVDVDQGNFMPHSLPLVMHPPPDSQHQSPAQKSPLLGSLPHSSYTLGRTNSSLSYSVMFS